MKIYHTDTFSIRLPAGHRFPIDKYRLLREQISSKGLPPGVRLRIPPPATDEEILRVHDGDYFERFCTGRLSAREIRRVGLPWSTAVVERARRSVGGTIAACRNALVDRISMNLGGGTHHAHRDHGKGYCWLNDCAIAVCAMLAEGRAKRVLIVDCDVHQGDGTAVIFMDDARVFTFSIHGKNNFPAHKQTSDMDIALADATDDGAYLSALQRTLPEAFERAAADLVVYLAGADPHHDDRIGRLGLTRNGLAQRDAYVLDLCRHNGLPVAITLAGGYGRQVANTVAVHMQTVDAAIAYCQTFLYSSSQPGPNFRS